MNIARQLFQLQEIETEIESGERSLEQVTSQLGDDHALVRIRTRLAQEQQRLEELKREQHSAEWELEDITSKIAAAEAELYSGKIKNPKELTNLQHEVDSLKAKRRQLEDKALEVMDGADITATKMATIKGELETEQAEWRQQQQQLSSHKEQLDATLADLRHKRQQLLEKIDPQSVELYCQLRRQKGQAVAKVEQGICLGCRISLPTAEWQRARSGKLVRCSSCGRILFLP